MHPDGSDGALPEHRLALLYSSKSFGGETTQRARVVRELITEIRRLRAEINTRDEYAR